MSETQSPAPSGPPLKVGIVPVTAFEQNCSLVWCTKTMRGALVDPGGDLPKLKAALEQTGVTLEKILLTHGHIDHCGQAGMLAKDLGVPIEGPHEGDRFWIEGLDSSAMRFGLQGESFEPDRWLKDGDTVQVGEVTFDVVHCPGHTPGHVVFHHPASHLAIVGDVLFAGSVGRTDLPQGSHEQLVDSITGKLWPLGDEVTFIPGHGPTSTFGQERRTNPFVADKRFG
jgi:hydroxyacylglutathione hydrolase